MDLILNNPFRVLGILVGAGPAQLNKHATRIPKYLEADEVIPIELIADSFPVLGKMTRSVESVNEAVSKLYLDNDKMSAALYWFYLGNDITDEPAFDSLKEKDQQKAIEIWTKLTSIGEVTQRNCSAFQNLSTLLLCNAFKGNKITIKLLEQAIELKLKFLESDFVKEFKAIATDGTYKATKKDFQLLFLNKFQVELEKKENFPVLKLLALLNKQDFTAKADLFKNFLQKPIEEIELHIKEAKKKREGKPADAIVFGNMLYEQVENDLKQLKSLLGTSNLKFSSISDKVADEILNCGIDYFYHYRDTNRNPSKNVMELYQTARALANGSIAKQRCDENIKSLQGWIEEQPPGSVKESAKFIEGELIKFQKLTNTIENAVHLVKLCNPKLEDIKIKLGQTDAYYLKISTLVAGNAQGMIVSTVNEAMDKRNKYVEYVNYQNSLIDPLGRLVLGRSIKSPPKVFEFSLGNLRIVISSAWEATIKLGSLDMEHEQRRHYNKNKESLKKLFIQLDDGIIFINDHPIEKILLWIAGIVLFLVILATCN